MTRTNSALVCATTAICLAAGLAFTGPSLQAGTPEKQRTFASAEEAIHATIDAAAHNDAAALLQLFGPDGKDILESGDPIADKAMRNDFAQSAQDKLSIEPDPGDPDRVTFSVGEQNWPFPVPVIRSAGLWRLDPVQGRLEVLARRVGRNELTTMELCRGYVEAQLEYASEDRNKSGMLQYAQKIASSPGRQDGLFSAADPSTGASLNLVPAGFAAASAGAKPEAYHGYYFRVLKSQGPAAMGGDFDYLVNDKMIGGFALIAWPAEYGVSGIQTFIINHEGLLFGKDLGPRTASLAAQITRFNPEKSWRQVELE